MTDHLTWNPLLREQINSQLRDRLQGLTDAEYFWEPAPGSWSVRPRGTGTAPVQAGSGAMTIDFAFPEPDPPPVTTIAWRLAHVIVGVLAMRNASHFGREATDYESFEYAETADEALAQLDARVRRLAGRRRGTRRGAGWPTSRRRDRARARGQPLRRARPAHQP